MTNAITTTLALLITLSIASCGEATMNSGSMADAGTADSASLADAGAAVSAVRDIAEAYVDPAGSPGMAVGLVVGIATPNGRLITGLGATHQGGTQVPDAHSLFDLASVTKVYTGYLLARSVANQEVTLTQSLETTFGEEVPRFDGQSINLLDLATHTSGLPDFPDNMTGMRPTPAAGYTHELLEIFLASHQLARAPSEQYQYSNVGSGILGEVLVDASGLQGYDALVQREIAVPYGLDDTTAAPNPSQSERWVQGHAMGLQAPHLDIGAPLQGGGILKASADDVLAFLEGAISGNDEAWQQVTEPRRPSPYGLNSMTGLLLNIEQLEDDSILYSKGGGAPGFTSRVMFTLEPPVAVVILSNANDTKRLRDLGLQLMEEAPYLEGL